MTVLTAVSRLTGLVRIVIVGAVIGDTFLGNTYSTTNAVPNLIFELMAAGTFQAVLIPALVRLIDQDRHTEAEDLAASVFGTALVVLSTIALAAMVASPLLARALFSGSDPSVRADQVRLGTVFLLIFLPQVGLYAAGLVSTGVLNAHGRFGVPAIAPAINNLIVGTAYGLFWWSRRGSPPTLDLTPVQIALLAGGTTAGVLGFCGLPLMALRRTAFRLRVRFDHRNPAVRRTLRLGAWAGGFLATTQILTLSELILSNRVRGGVVALQIGWTFFLLPYAMFAQPVLTARFPAMSRQAARADHEGFGRSVEGGAELICLFVVPVAIAYAAIAPALCQGILFGEIRSAGAEAVARVMVGFAPGVVGYGLLLFFSRASYARDDARMPTVVNLATGAVGSVVMFAGFRFVPTGWEVAALAATEATAYTVAAAVVGRRVLRSFDPSHRPALFARLRPQLIAVVPVAVAGVLVGRRVPVGSRIAALIGSGGVSLAILAAYLLITAAFGGPSPRRLVDALRPSATP